MVFNNDLEGKENHTLRNMQIQYLQELRNLGARLYCVEVWEKEAKLERTYPKLDNITGATRNYLYL